MSELRAVMKILVPQYHCRFTTAFPDLLQFMERMKQLSKIMSDTIHTVTDTSWKMATRATIG